MFTGISSRICFARSKGFAVADAKSATDEGINMVGKEKQLRAGNSISVIVPVYNASSTIERCIDSILENKIEKLQIITVDDGSTDGSSDLLEKFHQRDERITVIHKCNEGVAAARNTGLMAANGDYIAFIDADDYIDSNYFKNLLDEIIEHDADICYCFAYNEDEDGNVLRRDYGKSGEISSTEYDWMSGQSHCVVWGALFANRIVDGLRFDERLSVGEDTLFFAQCVNRSNRIYCLGQPMYHYVINRDSASHGKFDDKKYSDLIAWQKICQISDSKQSAIAAYAFHCKTMVSSNKNDEYFNNNYLRTTVCEYRKYYPVLLKYLFKNHRIRFLITCTMFELYTLFLN